MDSQKIIQIAERIVNSLIEFFQSDQFTKDGFHAVFSATILAKSIRKRAWSDKMHAFSELNMSWEETVKLLTSGIETIDVLQTTSPREIEDVRIFCE